ncbi:phosphoribosylglycinamide formyltransferase [Moraxella sp. VT-16-12]|nr:phosphoribosylglycinamide formyltransferase [Moraxella sp. VT-16-12]TWV80240.1 phosphoribosylglycinamide formyltransferase [Moraxella sp. VT-16-12]
MKNPLKIAVLVSGNGSNLQVLIDQMQVGKLPIEIVAVISNKADAYALTRAKQASITTFVMDKNPQGKTYPRAEFERLALNALQPLGVDLVVLAGFMKILTPLFINGVQDELNAPMINLHPSLLPAYKGLHTHERVLKTGDRRHGCSVHLVTTQLDAGQVLSQAVLDVGASDTPATLQNRVHELEYMLLPRTIDFIARGVIDLTNAGEPIVFMTN